MKSQASLPSGSAGGGARGHAIKKFLPGRFAIGPAVSSPLEFLLGLPHTTAATSAAIARAHQYQTYDAAYVETILLQERRRQELPSPTPLRPKRQELIAEIYREVLDQAARKNSSTLEVLSTLIAEEAIARSERALQRRIRQARLPKRKTLEEYDFTFPKRIPKQKVLRLFDCQFIEQHLCGVLIGPTGTGKSHLLTALGYNRAFRDWGKIFDVDNTLATAMIDRLMHHGEALVIRGDSYRMKDKNAPE